MIPIVEIVRLQEAHLDQKGTYGVLLINKELFCFTLEPFDEENAINISSIPAQQYLCKRIFRQSKGYYTYQVMNVPGRTSILFHPGNTAKDTEGCILLGLTKTFIGKLLSSSFVFDEFKKKINQAETFILSIKEVY